MLARTDSADLIPHRLFTLRALRALKRGNPFIVLGSASWDMMLDGAPFAPALFGYFLEHGWLVPLRAAGALPGVAYFGLSEKGRSFLEKGEAWWRTLGFWQKCQVAWSG